MARRRRHPGDACNTLPAPIAAALLSTAALSGCVVASPGGSKGAGGPTAARPACRDRCRAGRDRADGRRRGPHRSERSAGRRRRRHARSARDRHHRHQGAVGHRVGLARPRPAAAGELRLARAARALRRPRPRDRQHPARRPGVEPGRDARARAVQRQAAERERRGVLRVLPPAGDRLRRPGALQRRLRRHAVRHRERDAAGQPALLAPGHDVLGPSRRERRGAGHAADPASGRDGLRSCCRRHGGADREDGGAALLPRALRARVRRRHDRRGAHPAGARALRACDGLGRQRLGYRLCARRRPGARRPRPVAAGPRLHRAAGARPGAVRHGAAAGRARMRGLPRAADLRAQRELAQQRARCRGDGGVQVAVARERRARHRLLARRTVLEPRAGRRTLRLRRVARPPRAAARGALSAASARARR